MSLILSSCLYFTYPFYGMLQLIFEQKSLFAKVMSATVSPQLEVTKGKNTVPLSMGSCRIHVGEAIANCVTRTVSHTHTHVC